MSTAKELIAQSQARKAMVEAAKKSASLPAIPPATNALPEAVVETAPETPEVAKLPSEGWQPKPRVFTYYAAPKTKLELPNGAEAIFDANGKYTTTESREFAILDSLVDRFPGHFRKQGE